MEEVEKNIRLEKLSDKVRKGVPISIDEAIEVIEYQESLRAERDRKSIWKRIIRWISLNN